MIDNEKQCICWIVGKATTISDEVFYAVCRSGDQMYRAVELPGVFYKPIARLYLQTSNALTALRFAKAALKESEHEDQS